MRRSQPSKLDRRSRFMYLFHVYLNTRFYNLVVSNGSERVFKGTCARMCTLLHMTFYPLWLGLKTSWNQIHETECIYCQGDVEYVIMIYSANWEQSFSFSWIEARVPDAPYIHQTQICWLCIRRLLMKPTVANLLKPETFEMHPWYIRDSIVNHVLQVHVHALI